MKRSSGPRKTVTLSDSLQKRISIYALAGSAAGVLALAEPADAKIVYTPAHKPISGSINIDLNHDGIVDFKIRSVQFIDAGGLVANSLGENRVWGSKYASHLLPGVVINSNPKKFGKGSPYCGYSESFTCKVMAWYWTISDTQYHRGPWAKQKGIGYLGFKFHIAGKAHFGWARLRAEKVGWVLTGYAYETIAGKPIVTGKTEGAEGGAEEGSVDEANPAALHEPTPQPASLGLLALGSSGLSVWRREESVGAP